MGFLKQLLGKYVNVGSHGGGRGSKHGGGGSHGGGKHGYGYPQQPNNYENPAINNPSGKVCSGCNTVNLNDAKFCQQCGNSFRPAVCGQCNTTLLSDAKFCPQCGKPR